MASTEERLRILEMISEGQISAEDGAKLIEALRETAGDGAPDQPTKPRWLRVRVTDLSSNSVRLNVNIPLGLLDVGIKMGARFAPNMSGMDLLAVQSAINQGLQGRILAVEDEQEDERVEIFVE